MASATFFHVVSDEPVFRQGWSMNKHWVYAALGVAVVYALAACAVQPPAGPSADYQAPVAAIPPPANVAAVCYDQAALTAYRERMVQQEMTVGVLSCKGADGNLAFVKKYGDFIKKFNDELASNAEEMKAVTTSRKANFDVVITEIANRTAQQPTGDKLFCSRFQRALDWSLSPKVTSLAQVPAPYDFGPEMDVYTCPKK